MGGEGSPLGWAPPGEGGGEAGLGLVLDIRAGGRVMVAGVARADRPGTVRAGDEIVEVNGQPLFGKKPAELRAMSRGPAGTKVKLLLLRNGEVLEDVLTMTNDILAGPSNEVAQHASAAIRGLPSNAAEARTELEAKMHTEIRATLEERARRLEEELVKSRRHHAQRLQDELEKWRAKHVEQLRDQLEATRVDLGKKLKEQIVNTREKHKDRLEEEVAKSREESLKKADARLATIRADQKIQMDQALDKLRADSALKLQQQIGAERERLKQKLIEPSGDQHVSKYSATM